VGDFNSQDIANTVWAFAKACQSDAPLFAALASVSELRMGDFNSQALANTGWAFATVIKSNALLFA